MLCIVLHLPGKRTTRQLRPALHSQDWLDPAPVPGAGWCYFSARMRVRVTLRHQLRRLEQFLDPLSRACLRPGATQRALAEAEASLQLLLPWEAWELWRAHNGQEVRVGVHFAEGARLLSLAEVRALVQGEHGPAALGKAFALWLAAWRRRQGQREALPRATAQPASNQSIDSGASSSAEAPGGSGRREPPPILLPLTDTLRGGRFFALDFGGRVWLQSGFNTVLQADSLTAFLRGILS